MSRATRLARTRAMQRDRKEHRAQGLGPHAPPRWLTVSPAERTVLREQMRQICDDLASIDGSAGYAHLNTAIVTGDEVVLDLSETPSGRPILRYEDPFAAKVGE